MHKNKSVTTCSTVKSSEYRYSLFTSFYTSSYLQSNPFSGGRRCVKQTQYRKFYDEVIACWVSNKSVLQVDKRSTAEGDHQLASGPLSNPGWSVISFTLSNAHLLSYACRWAGQCSVCSSWVIPRCTSILGTCLICDEPRICRSGWLDNCRPKRGWGVTRLMNWIRYNRIALAKLLSKKGWFFCGKKVDN